MRIHRTSAAKSIVAAFVAVLLFLSGTTLSSAALDDWTVLVVKDDYQPAKFEPVSGAYLGAYVIQDEFIKADMNTFNEVTGKQHASYFRYVGYGKPFPQTWVDSVIAAGAVPHIAFEPNNGLDEVEDNAYLREFAQAANASGVPIFLRYASEMNGTWAAYSGDPKQYIEKWRLVHQVMEEEAPNVAMVWTVFTFPEQSITSYYPGDEYVDWVGVNVYNVVYHNNDLRNRGDKEDPLKLLDYVYNTFSARKPIQISEFGATHYTVTDNSYHIDFAAQKITRMYKWLPTLYPRVKSIFYFDVNNLVNAPVGRKINDYSITNDPIVLNAYKNIVAKDYYLSKVTEMPTEPRQELLSVRGLHFDNKGTLYSDVDVFRQFLGLKVDVIGSRAIVSSGAFKKTYTIVSKSIPKGFYGDTRRVKGLPVRAIANDFGYKIKLDISTKTIQLLKK
ncbi:glycosyl hydrolase [Cohnella sp.]|uniref:glycosyl hydrolase n=1 Tax=Cohnella sp. TaxID=1883426 RepID=UPI003569F1C1